MPKTIEERDLWNKTPCAEVNGEKNNENQDLINVLRALAALSEAAEKRCKDEQLLAQAIEKCFA